ncbi:MAG: LpxI family protein [Candidatus Omnitrophica bacterium]|nr:LpxI family protein [Candidatus Omnitrophota bacterium]
MNKIGLIAGNGKFPILFAQAAKNKRYKVICIAITEETDKSIAEFVDKIFWIGLGEFSRLFSVFKQEGIKKAIMAGQIKKVHIFDKELRLDKEAKNLLNSVRDKRDTSLLSTVINRLKMQGIEVINSATFLDEFLPQPGLLTKRHPTEDEKRDIEFGFPIAKEIAGLDIGQTIVIKDKVVVSVEAVEGTDEAIRRAAVLAGPGLVVIKVARPSQDMRFDIPVIGLTTIRTLVEVGSRVIAVEARKTLLIDRENLIEFANTNDISLIAI